MWEQGIITVKGKDLSYCIQYFKEPSEFGINGGRISKLEVCDKGKTLIHYTRGWDIRPTTKLAKYALDSFIDNFN